MTRAKNRVQLWAAAILICGFALAGCGGQTFKVEDGNSSFGSVVKYNTEVDVLWVIDTSGSMAKRQQALSQHVPEFITGLNATGLDYHIGVTTMDMGNGGERGKLLAQAGTPQILTRDTPNLVGLLMGRIQAGEAGSPVERGREATLSALMASTPGGSNPGFLRQNALLNVIYLSDEEDESSNSVDYVGQLDAIKPKLPYGDHSWVAHFIGVMPGDPACQTAEWGFSSSGQRYIALSEASGGSKQSICDADFKRALTNVTSRILEVQTEFALDRKPIVKTLKVFLDGVEVAQDEVNGWTYHEAANSIRFHGTAIPGVNSRIQVTFDPEGLK